MDQAVAPRVLAIVLLVGSPSAFALDRALDASQYAHTAWRVREGFARGAIVSIAQTEDGYLWLGTEFGLLRFDGVRAVPWQPPSGQALPSTSITRLVAARDGTLWIGTLKGLASWKDGTLRQLTELAGQQIHSLLEDHEGALWAGTINNPAAKLCAIRNGSARCYEEAVAVGDGVYGLYEDSKGALWVGMRAALWRWEPEPRRRYPLTEQSNGIRALGEDDDGTLLVGMRGGLQRFVGGKTEPFGGTLTRQPFQAHRLLRDRDGGLWVATIDKGLLHAHGGKTDGFTRGDGLSGDYLTALFEDREGTLWVATLDGLDRFRELAVPTFSTSQGLLGARAGAVLAARDESVWIATNGGLNRWLDGRVTVPLTGGSKRDGKLAGLDPHSLFQDRRGRIWVTTYGGVGYLEGEGFVSVRGLPHGNVQAIAEDAGGSLWLSNVNAGLFVVSPRNEVEEIPSSRLGRTDTVTALAADPSRGMWIGFREGGIVSFTEGEVRASYGTTDGLSGGRVNRLRFDPEGTLWAGTDGGLNRLKNGRIATLTSRNGLPCDGVHWGIEDDARVLWLRTACGLVRLPHGELAAWAAAADKGQGTTHRIQATVFDESDGVLSRALGSGYVPPVTKSTDGRVWFAASDGVSVFDPMHLAVNMRPPPVHIEGVVADRRPYELTSDVGPRLPPRTRDLQIDYTALSLAAPEKVRFRYKLEGWDRDWQDAGTRRQAFYGNLPPRDYRFRVTACNNSGVWNEAGTFLDFSVAPAYYQTTWFRLACVALFAALLAALYRLRLRQVTQRMRLRMEGRLEERERIARDLHDTLLQSVQGLILKFDAVGRQIPSDEPARKAIEQTLDHADRVLAEGRDRVRNLRSALASQGDLCAAFQRLAEEAPRDRPVRFKTVVEGREQDLHPMVLEESYVIGREAVLNALTHSDGQNVEVEITYDPRRFRLRIRDDGRGLESKVLEEGGRAGHWGLQGMRERAQRMGAELQLWSRPGSGTEIELTVPAATAYRGVRAGRSWFRRRPAAPGPP